MDNNLIPSVREVIGENLKKFRESKQITIYRLINETGLSRQQLNAIEKGETSYTIDSFIKYISALNLYIFFGEKNFIPTQDKPHDFDDMLKSGEENKPYKEE